MTTATTTTTEPRPLTARQREVLEFIADFQVREGRPPKIREIAEHLSLSPQCGTAVIRYLKQLQDKGFVERKFYRAASVRIIAAPGPGWIAFPGGVWLREAEAWEATRGLLRWLVEAADKRDEGPSVAGPGG